MLLLVYLAIMASALGLSSAGFVIPSIIIGAVGMLLAYRWTVVATAKKCRRTPLAARRP